MQATPIGPSSARHQRGSRGPTSASTDTIASETTTGAIAKLGSPGRKPSIEPSKAAPPYIAAAVYAMSFLFRLRLCSEDLTQSISASLRPTQSSRDGVRRFAESAAPGPAEA